MENIKSKIIPDELKENIDELMEQQLFNANRYYAETNPDINDLIKREMNNSPDKFLKKLIDRWNWHNSYYESLLEPAFIDIIRDEEKELSPKEIDDLMNVYFTSCLVDEATLIMSGAIKKYLDHIYKKMFIKDENFSFSSSAQMLITPPVETFFAEYQIDHLYYIYLMKTKDMNLYKFKNYIKNKYHANDEKIFQFRFKKRFNKYLSFKETDILEEIEKYKIADAYKINHFYFTLEHPERKAIRDIIIFDNLYEKRISCNLIGVSGFFLRKKILEYLNNSSILKNEGYIYQYSNEVVLNALQLLKEERKNKMDKNVRPYKQRGETCAIACLMMTLEYYGIMIKANWYDERRLYRIYGSRYMSGTPFSAIAYHISKNGLDTTLYHSSKNLFDNSLGAISDIDFKFAMDEYKEYLERAKLKGTKVINGIDINSNLLKKKLQEGNLIILAGKSIGSYHAILISGYEGNTFMVCDPLYKTKKTRTFEEIDEYMDTNIGKWFIAINNKTKEKDILLNSLDKFNFEAKEMMKIEKKDEKKYVKK